MLSVSLLWELRSQMRLSSIRDYLIYYLTQVCYGREIICSCDRLINHRWQYGGEPEFDFVYSGLSYLVIVRSSLFKVQINNLISLNILFPISNTEN